MTPAEAPGSAPGVGKAGREGFVPITWTQMLTDGRGRQTWVHHGVRKLYGAKRATGKAGNETEQQEQGLRSQRRLLGGGDVGAKSREPRRMKRRKSVHGKAGYMQKASSETELWGPPACTPLCPMIGGGRASKNADAGIPR